MNQPMQSFIHEPSGEKWMTVHRSGTESLLDLMECRGTIVCSQPITLGIIPFSNSVQKRDCAQSAFWCLMWGRSLCHPEMCIAWSCQEGRPDFPRTTVANQIIPLFSGLYGSHTEGKNSPLPGTTKPFLKKKKRGPGSQRQLWISGFCTRRRKELIPLSLFSSIHSTNLFRLIDRHKRHNDNGYQDATRVL